MFRVKKKRKENRVIKIHQHPNSVIDSRKNKNKKLTHTVTHNFVVTRDTGALEASRGVVLLGALLVGGGRAGLAGTRVWKGTRVVRNFGDYISR